MPESITTFDQYQAAAARTLNKPTVSEVSVALLTAAIGLNGEAGELGDAVKKHVSHGYDYDETRRRVLDEAGDVLWYLTATLSLYDLTLEEAAQHNDRKLQERYPDGFVKGGGNR